MSTFKAITINRRADYGSQLARAINDYWRCETARSTTNTLYTGSVTSDMCYGVPRVASITRGYIHADIIRVRRFGRTWNIVGVEK